MLWTTSIAANDAVTVSDLSDLSILVYDESDALVFTDNAIVGGVAQPISGITRQLGDLGFDAISGGSISSFDNANAADLLDGSTGTTFNLYGLFDDVIVFARYESGVFTGPNTDFTVTSQVTTSPIPEPSAFAALAGAGALSGALVRRRRRRSRWARRSWRRRAPTRRG